MTGLILRLQLSSWWRDRRLAAVLLAAGVALAAATAWSTARQ